MLPADLRSAEAEAIAAVTAALADDPAGRWTLELRFEGLRLLPVVLRLCRQLREQGQALGLRCSDMGATALARRDAPDLADCIASFGDEHRQQQQQQCGEGLLVLLGAAPADVELVEAISDGHRGALLLVNGQLEDAAIGIGSVARGRRRGFLARWQAAYALIPSAASALRRAYPGPWELYRLDADGFRAAASFEQRPDAEQQADALATPAANPLAAGLGAVDRLARSLEF
ncbi:MAG: DUF1995 family protein [Cyanobacteriota bacterium]|jgi:hypothetical protein|nr:DUF1995 family protein [Cyanobacteriota bacterium]